MTPVASLSSNASLLFCTSFHSLRRIFVWQSASLSPPSCSPHALISCTPCPSSLPPSLSPVPPSQALNTLLEAIQGPCFENQLALVRSNFLAITQRMLSALQYREEDGGAGPGAAAAANSGGGGGKGAAGGGGASGGSGGGGGAAVVQPAIRHSPQVIASILSYTALGSRPAGGAGCPLVGREGVRGMEGE